MQRYNRVALRINEPVEWIWRRVTQQRWTILSIFLLVPIGFYTKSYRGPASDWVNHSLGGTFYVIFWCLVVRCIAPKGSAARIAGAVLVATCCIEFLQLWHPPFLEVLRRDFAGAAILGTTFEWSDFPPYFLGAAFGWLWMRLFPA
jgi:Protein of unknown function (DUF2809)